MFKFIVWVIENPAKHLSTIHYHESKIAISAKSLNRENQALRFGPCFLVYIFVKLGLILSN